MERTKNKIKPKHGGARKGSGAKKKPEHKKKKSKVMRIPLDKVEDVIKLCKGL